MTSQLTLLRAQRHITELQREIGHWGPCRLPAARPVGATSCGGATHRYTERLLTSERPDGALWRCGTCGMLVVVGTMVRDILMGSVGQLRYEPVEKRIRGVIAGPDRPQLRGPV